MADATDDTGPAGPTIETGDPDAAVGALVARGDYQGAAVLAARAGDLRRAISLLERVWRFADAVPLALSLGDRPLAVRLALDGRDLSRARDIAMQIADDDAAQIAHAATLFAARGFPAEGAAQAARARQWDRAAALYRDAGLMVEAARMMERASRIPEAGRAYERIAAGDGPHVPDDDRRAAAAAQLALGRLLGAMGRHHESARALQVAARHADTAVAARRRLCVELLALRLPHAAHEIARRLHDADPTCPADPVAIANQEIAGAPATDRDDAALDLPVPPRFRVVRALGSSAIGRLYEAYDELLGRPVALKVLAVGAGAAGPEHEAFRRFVREAEAIGRLRHPHIVTLHELEESGGHLVLELLPGGTLADRLAAQPDARLDPGAARRLALDLLSGLAAAHAAGVIHRDVKPANIFFDAAGNAKLGDFGAAHLLDFGDTQTGAFIGTLTYLSPEQASGSRIGFAADLYALAVTLFEVLVGRPPFGGPDLVAQHLSETPPRPSTLAAGLSPVHDDVVLRALAKAPTDRYPSADAMAAAVEAWPAVWLTAAEAPPVPGRATAPTPHLAPGSLAPPDVSAATTIDSQGGGRLAASRRPAGRSARGQVFAARDERVGRDILIEELDEPMDDPATVRLRELAAAGGPHVQRVLSLAADRTTVAYEIMEGAAVPLSALSASEARCLDHVWSRLEPLGLGPAAGRRVVRAAGGPVVLTLELVAPPPSQTGGE